jgi:hypothetical protein
MLPPVAIELIASRHPVRSTVSLSMSTSGTMPQRRRTSALTRRRLRAQRRSVIVFASRLRIARSCTSS